MAVKWQSLASGKATAKSYGNGNGNGNSDNKHEPRSLLLSLLLAYYYKVLASPMRIPKPTFLIVQELSSPICQHH